MVRIRATGRKGWLAAFRDAALFRVAYGYGLRRREVAMLDLVDFGTNPHASEFGDFGVCRVRFGKARKAPRIRIFRHTGPMVDHSGYSRCLWVPLRVRCGRWPL